MLVSGVQHDSRCVHCEVDIAAIWLMSVISHSYRIPLLLWWKLLRSTLLAISNMQYCVINQSRHTVCYIPVTSFRTGSWELLTLGQAPNTPHPTPSHPLSPLKPPSLTPAMTNPSSVSLVGFWSGWVVCLTFRIPHTSEIIWYLSFSIWLISLSL